MADTVSMTDRPPGIVLVDSATATRMADAASHDGIHVFVLDTDARVPQDYTIALEIFNDLTQQLADPDITAGKPTKLHVYIDTAPAR